MVDFSRILVPVDFSVESELAVEWAVGLLKGRQGARILLLHVGPPPPTRLVCVTGSVCLTGWKEDSVRSEWEKEKWELECWQQKIPEPIRSDVIIETGCVATAVRRMCLEYAVDLVIMTKRTRCGLSRLVHPHSCVRTVRWAACPILVLHANSKTRRLAMAH